ncbi:MAG TPA: DNA-3-methyladenine glycosylase [Coriobacteriia bacterium]|jgi:DNA-3-methyladenine glycosylase
MGFDLHSAALLPPHFFERDTVTVARELLGKVLVSIAGDTPAGGRIVETEAYLGPGDPGSHAYRGMTPRTSVMFGPPGRVYVYFAYGNHHMLNLITESDGVAGGVLVRAIEPLFGIGVMERRRKGRPLAELTNGPGKLAAALGVDLSDYGSVLGTGRLAVYGAPRPPEPVAASGRVGLSAGWDEPLRFYLEGNPFVSKGSTGPPRKPRAVGEKES